MHRAPQTSLAAIPDGLVSGGYDGRVFRLGSDARTVVWGRALPELVNDIAVHDDKVFAVGAFRACLALDLDTGEVIGKCAEDSDDLNAVAIPPTGGSLFCGGESGRLIRVDAPLDDSSEIVISNAFDCINGISLLPGSDRGILVGDDEGVLTVLDFDGNELRRCFVDGSIECVTATSGRAFAGLDDGRVLSWNFGTGDLLRLHTHDSAVKAIALSRETDRLATAGYDNVLCILSTDGTVIARKCFTGKLRDGWARCLAFSSSGPARLYVSALSGAPRVLGIPALDPLSGEAPATPGLNAVANWGGEVWQGGDDGKLISGSAVKNLGDMVLSAEADARGLAVGTRDGRLHLMDSQGKLTRTDATRDPLNSVRWSGDGLIATGSYNGKISVLDCSLARMIEVSCGAAVKDLCWVYDRLLAVALADGALVGIDSKDGSIQWRRDDLYLLNSVDWHPDAGRIVTVGRDMQVRTWAADGQPVAEVSAHRRSIKCVRYAPNGDRFATSGYDGDVIVWDVEDMRQIARFQAHDMPGASALAWLDDGRVASVGFDGRRVICRAPHPAETTSRPVGAGDPDWAVGLNAGSIRLVSRGRSVFHAWAVYHTANWGVALEVDGDLQSAEIDQEIYHRTMILPALNILGESASDVLVLGAGPGGSLPPLMRTDSIRRVTMIDVDPDMVRAVRPRMYPWHRNLFKDPRVREMWGDAEIVLPTLDPAGYDLVIVDFTDYRFDALAVKILQRNFWRMVKRVLRPHGVVAVQSGEPEDVSGLERMLSAMNPYFSTQVTRRALPSFGGDWCFAIATKRDSGR